MDVFYWPVPGANSDCVSTIGSSFNDPASELLVTDNRGYPYWKAQPNPWGQNGSQNVNANTIPPEQALANAVNPLDVPSYIIQAREYQQPNITLTGNLSSTEAIATIGNFRWYVILCQNLINMLTSSSTSPSVCVGFSNIYAADVCGALSTDGEMIPYTIIAFAPEELSTIETPAWVRASDPPKAVIKPFNFADLPCPPQSVMVSSGNSVNSKCLTRDPSTLQSTSLLLVSPTGRFSQHLADSALFCQSGRDLVASYRQPCSTVLIHQEF